MNIIELCLSGGFGGLEIYAFRAAQAMGMNHNVLAILDKNGKLAKHFRGNTDINTEYLNYSRSYLPLINARKLAGLIDNHNIDVIHMHWSNDLALAALAKKMSRRKPALVYTRQMKITRYKTDLYHRFLYNQMDLMLTITNQLENEAKTFIPEHADQITTLYYGVDAPAHILTAEEIHQQRSELGFKDSYFIIGLLGRLEHGKGQHLLIEALSMARNDNLAPKALIVGHEMNPGYRAELQKLAKANNLGDSVVFMDFVSEPQKLMQLCDCIALTTFEETFGLVLPEAMRCGVAVIGSNKGGVPEIIRHEETGLLFESLDASSLYRQIRHLYTDAEFRKMIAINGNKEANARFNTEYHFSALEKHLQQAIS